MDRCRSTKEEEPEDEESGGEDEEKERPAATRERCNGAEHFLVDDRLLG